MSTGVDSQSMAILVAQTRDLGSETHSMNIAQSSTVSTGAQTETMAASATGSATYPQGTQTEQDTFSAAQTRDVGSESAAFAASAVADLSQHTSTATAVNNQAGPPTWQNPTNAQGGINGTEASILHDGSGAPPPTTANADLKCVLPAIGSTPSGFTRTDVFIRVVHRWDLTITGAVTGVSDVQAAIQVYDSTGAFLLANLIVRQSTTGGGTQATLITEDFDIDGVISEADLAAGIQVWCHFQTIGAVTPAVQGSSGWNVDAVHLLARYTRSGIT